MATDCWRSIAAWPKTMRPLFPRIALPVSSTGSILIASMITPGSGASLIQEIWRLFLILMLVALVLEAVLCLPRKASSSAARPSRRFVTPTSKRGGMSSDAMKSVYQFTFMGTPLSVLISVLVVAVTAGLGYFAWRRSGYSRSVGGLELLRVAIVALVAALLNQPEWIQEYPPESKPTIAVLWDQSASMQTVDVVTSDSAVAVSRAEAIEPLTRAAAWQRLDERLNVLVQPIAGLGDSSADEPAAQRTDLHQPLANVGDRVSQLLGIVLISDGDWNDGPPPVEAASRLRTKGIPIFTVAAGSPTRLPDVELTSFDLPTFGDRRQVRSHSAHDRQFAAARILDHRLAESFRRRNADQGRSHRARWAAPTNRSIGNRRRPATTRSRSPFRGMATRRFRTTTRWTAPIAIRQEKLKVLVVESYPRWEYRYLRNALSRDPGVDVSCLLFHPGLDKVGGGSSDYIKEFPEAIEELAQFDVVFLGDVGLDDGQLTVEQCELIKGLVEHQASGLVFMPGWQGRQFSAVGHARWANSVRWCSTTPSRAVGARARRAILN